MHLICSNVDITLPYRGVIYKPNSTNTQPQFRWSYFNMPCLDCRIAQRILDDDGNHNDDDVDGDDEDDDDANDID